MASPNERRKDFRLKTTKSLTHVKFSFYSGDIFSGEAVTKDLSAGGLLFESTHLYPIGDVIRIEMKLPGWDKYREQLIKPGAPSSPELLITLAEVVRSEIVRAGFYEIGVAFVGIDEAHQRALKKYIQEHSH